MVAERRRTRKSEDAFQLKSIKIQNFKSLKHVEISLRNLNVLVGSNGAGKSNILDVFRFLGDVTSAGVINPFIRYGGYKNLVWRGNEELPIGISLTWQRKSKKVKVNELEYSIMLSGYGGSLDILNEKITFGKATIEKDHNKIKIVDGKKKIDITTEKSSLLNVDLAYIINLPDSKMSKGKMGGLRVAEPSDYRMPIIEVKKQISQMHVHNLNPHVMKETSKFESINKLDFEGRNVQTFLYNVFSREGHWKPEVMERLKQLFPTLENMSLAPTEDGRVMLKITENGLELKPNSISDGFFKILAILVLGTEIKNSTILIDEIENSIYPEAIEILIDVLQESRNTVIITTHSPIVLNMVEVEDILLLSKDADETVISKVKQPKKMKKILEDKGISLGEGWLYHILE